ncbi:MAG: helix-turn-helix domain-containing protein [Muribaculaceae bacterium]
MKQYKKRGLTIDELWCNRQVMSVNKYGFFLCLEGTARVLLGKEVYNIYPGCLCIYTPNTFIKILERSDNLNGILEEDVVDTYYPVVTTIDIHKRLQIRHAPCVEIASRQVESIARLIDILNGEDDEEGLCALHLRYAICLKVLDVYFKNTPVSAVELSRNDVILNRFIASVYENCHRQRTVQFYADEQHLSPYYFSSIIKGCSGKSAIQWIENVTMTFARQYIECSELSLKQISDRLCFPDQSTFGRYFKKHEGCSPSEYRNNKFKNN